MARESDRLYFPYIDGLRAVSIVAVVLFHLDPKFLPGGFGGVDVFFVVSGFIVSASLHGYQPSSFFALVTHFYARRFRRIAPALLLMLLATTLAVVVFVPESYLSGNVRRTAIAAFFGFSNFRLASGPSYFEPRAEFNPLTHTWSLGVEEQFYLIFPTLIFLLAAGGRIGRASLYGLFGLCALSFAYGFVEASTRWPLGFYSSFSRFWELGVGVLLYAILARAGLFERKAQAARELRFATYLGSALIAAGLIVGNPETYPVPGALLPVAGGLLVIVGLQGRKAFSWPAQVLSSTPAVAIGKISYSLYLWHWPVFVLFRWTVGFSTPGQKLAALAVAIALSLISYLLVEQPFRGSWRLRTPWQSVVTYLVAVALFAWIADRTFANTSSMSASVVTAHREDWYPGYQPRAHRRGNECRVDWRTSNLGGEATMWQSQRVNCDGPDDERRLFVLGDSHATSYRTMLEDYVRSTSMPVALYQLPGCNIVHLQPTPEFCRTFLALALDGVTRQLKAGDVVFLPSLRVPRFRDQWSDEVRDVSAVWKGILRLSDAGFATSIKILERLSVPGVHIVLELPKPIFPTNLFKCADWFNRNNPTCSSGIEMARTLQEQHRQPVLVFAEKLQASMPGLATWDPFPVLCPEQTCSMMMNGKPLYFDGDHVSAFANRLLLPSFMKRMSELGVATRQSNLR